MWPMKLSDQVRRAVESCPRSRNSVCREAGIDPGAFSNFMAGRRGMSLASLDRLAEVLDLRIVVGQQKRRKPSQAARAKKTTTARRQCRGGDSGAKRKGR